MGRGGNEISAETLLYGQGPLLKQPKVPWDESKARALSSGQGSFCFDRDTQRLAVSYGDGRTSAFSLPQEVDDVEEVGAIDGLVAASWQHPEVFKDDLRIIGLGQYSGSRKAEIREAVTARRHSQTFVTRDSSGQFRLSYIDKNYGLHCEPIDSGGVTDRVPVGLATKIHDLKIEDGRSLLLADSALGAPPSLKVYDLVESQEIARVELRSRHNSAAMSTMDDGTPVISAIDDEGNLSIYVNNERLAHFPESSRLPTIEAAPSWMTRDNEGAVYVVWLEDWLEQLEDEGAEVCAARISKEERGEYRVEHKRITSTDFASRPVLTSGERGLHIGWAPTVFERGPLPAKELWYGTGEAKAEWKAPENVLTI